MSEAPILDLQQDPPKRRIGKLGLAIGVLVGAMLGVAMEAAEPATSSPFSVVWWITGLYVGIAIHKLGHFVAARLAGMQPVAWPSEGFV